MRFFIHFIQGIMFAMWSPKSENWLFFNLKPFFAAVRPLANTKSVLRWRSLSWKITVTKVYSMPLCCSSMGVNSLLNFIILNQRAPLYGPFYSRGILDPNVICWMEQSTNWLYSLDLATAPVQMYLYKCILTDTCRRLSHLMQINENEICRTLNLTIHRTEGSAQQAAVSNR